MTSNLTLCPTHSTTPRNTRHDEDEFYLDGDGECLGTKKVDAGSMAPFRAETQKVDAGSIHLAALGLQPDRARHIYR